MSDELVLTVGSDGLRMQMLATTSTVTVQALERASCSLNARPAGTVTVDASTEAH